MITLGAFKKRSSYSVKTNVPAYEISELNHMYKKKLQCIYVEVNLSHMILSVIIRMYATFE
jgi:hypothetical protein